uniref:Probable glycerol kinase n=1 Tax=Acrobeloides nanus TaxID=290746 RepID=A0A914D4B0_9BILA
MVLLGAIDQGTSSSRFIVFEADSCSPVADHQIEVKQLFPEPGWVEMDPEEIYSTVVECIEKTCTTLQELGITLDELKAVGIANQRETTVVWDRESGKPLYNAIVWLDGRTSDLAEECIQRCPSREKDYFKPKAGLPISPYFSALKLRWLLQNVEAVRAAKERGSLCFGTIDTWLLWRLTGSYVTDVTNASRTLLMDIHKRKWSSELCAFFEIPFEILPEIRSSAEIYGYFSSGSLKGIPISGCLGDQQAAMVGHGCLDVGDTKNTYGTGTFMLCNTGTNQIVSKHGLLTTVGFQFGPNAPVCYALEGSGSIGGNVVRFLRDNFGFIQNASEIEELAKTVDDTNGVYFVPAFSGLYTPYWDSTARGLIIGLTQGTTRAHIALAALKSVTFQTAEMLDSVESDLHGYGKIQTLKMDGGMTKNQLFNQLQADTLGRSIICSKFPDITGLGAAIAAGIGTGHLTLEEFSRNSNSRTISYQPKISEVQKDNENRRWKEAVKRARNWTQIVET